MVVREGRARRGSPSRSTWRCGTATAWCWPRTRRRRPAAACGTTGCSARSTPARTARSATRSWSRGRSASTARTGRVRRARGSGRAWRSTRSWSCPTPSLSLAAGAVAPWKGETPAALRKHQNHLRPFLAKAGIRWNTPLEKLTPKLREQLLHGDGQAVPRRAGNAGEGVRHDDQRDEAAAAGGVSRRGGVQGVRRRRLRPEARAVRVAGKAIHEVTALTVAARRGKFFSQELCRSRRRTSSRSPSRSSARSPRGWISWIAWAWAI